MIHKIYIVTLSIILFSCERSTTSTAMKDKIQSQTISVEAEDQEMQGAMQSARDQFPKFWEEVSTDYRRVIPVLQRPMVKAYFLDKNESEGGEHMWVGDVQYDGEIISGILIDKPRYIQSVDTGDKVRFPLERLSDWLYVERNTAVGAFTVKLLRTRMSEEERKRHDSHYPFKFD